MQLSEGHLPCKEANGGAERHRKVGLAYRRVVRRLDAQLAVPIVTPEQQTTRIGDGGTVERSRGELDETFTRDPR